MKTLLLYLVIGYDKKINILYNLICLVDDAGQQISFRSFSESQIYP